MKSLKLTTLVVVAALLSCGPEPTTEAPSGWIVDHATDEGAILSVWGSRPDDVWAAGGQVDESLLLHNDGTGWRRVDVVGRQLLWWVYGFTNEDLYAVGNNGLILYYDGETWTQVASGTSLNLYGVWGASPDDVWIVGGDPNGEPGSAVVLRGARESFREVEIPAELAPRSLFKAYGAGVDDVLVVGSGGTVLRYDGASWRREETPTTAPLFSMWGRSPRDVYAVGGSGGGELLHFDGATWSRMPDESGRGIGGLSGVFTADDQPVIAVGDGAYVLEVDADGTHHEPVVPVEPWTSLHGVWGDSEGTTWAVGGMLNAYPGPMTGVILRRD